MLTTNVVITTVENAHGGFLVGLGTEGISKSSGIGARFQTARFRRAAGLLSVGEVEAAGMGACTARVQDACFVRGVHVDRGVDSGVGGQNSGAHTHHVAYTSTSSGVRPSAISARS